MRHRPLRGAAGLAGRSAVVCRVEWGWKWYENRTGACHGGRARWRPSGKPVMREVNGCEEYPRACRAVDRDGGDTRTRWQCRDWASRGGGNRHTEARLGTRTSICINGQKRKCARAHAIDAKASLSKTACGRVRMALASEPVDVRARSGWLRWASLSKNVRDCGRKRGAIGRARMARARVPGLGD